MPNLDTTRIFAELFQDGRLTKDGKQLCKDVGVEPAGLLPKTIDDFKAKGVSEELARESL